MKIKNSFKLFFKALGVLLVSIILFFFACVVFPYRYTPLPEQPENVILIKNINIIDVETDSILLNHHVLTKNGIIEFISEKPIALSGSGQKKIDGTNKFLVSGFWDMHTHLMNHSPFVAYPEFVRHGVTHARDMRGAHNGRSPFAGVMEKLVHWNQLVKNGKLIGPELHSYTSFAVDGPGEIFKNSPDFFNCSSPEEAVKLVKYFHEQNISLIKVYNNIPPAAFFQLMKEAAKYGIDVAGHKPLKISTIEASDAGMKSLEHARFFIWDSFEGSENLRNSVNPQVLDNTQLRKKMLEKHDTAMLKEMFEAFTRNNTWYCPTHLTRKADALAGDSLFREKYNHINPVLRFLAFEDLDATLKEGNTPEDREVYNHFYLKGLEISRQASAYGVKILAGADVPELPGSSLHDELVELSKAGLAPYEVLRAATLYPAMYYGISESYGSIKIGKVADLVILAKNPIGNIGNVREIHGIIQNGVFLDSKFLEKLENQVASRRTGIVMTCKLIWDVLVDMVL